jgi:hypothetical protein
MGRIAVTEFSNPSAAIGRYLLFISLQKANLNTVHSDL